MKSMGRHRRGAIFAVAFVALAGCSATTPGTAQPTSTAAGGTSTTITATPPLKLPPRPATLSVAGIDPCALIPPAERARLEIDRPAKTDPSDPDKVVQGRLCAYSVSQWGAYSIELSDKFSAQEFINQTKKHASANTLIDIGGFPTVQSYRPDLPGGCLEMIDIADTAVLYVAATDRRDYTVKDGKLVCSNAFKAAGVALTALKAMQK